MTRQKPRRCSTSREALVEQEQPFFGEELRDYCKGQVSHQKIPRYFQFVDAYPMTTSGKVQKFVLREKAIRALGLEEVVKGGTWCN